MSSLKKWLEHAPQESEGFAIPGNVKKMNRGDTLCVWLSGPYLVKGWT